MASVKTFRFNSGLVYRDGDCFRVRASAASGAELTVEADGKTEVGEFTKPVSLFAIVEAETGEPGPNPITLQKDKTYTSFFEFIFLGECVLTKEVDPKGQTWLIVETSGKVSFFGQESDLPVSAKSFEGASWVQFMDKHDSGDTDPIPHGPHT